MKSVLSVLFIFIIWESVPCPGQFLPVAVQVGPEPTHKEGSMKNNKVKTHETKNRKEVDFVTPSDPDYTKTHEENVVLPIKPEVTNLLLPLPDENSRINLTDLLLPEEISKIENTSKPLQDFIAKVLTGFIRRHENSKTTNNPDSTTSASEHIMKIPNDKDNDIVPAESTVITFNPSALTTTTTTTSTTNIPATSTTEKHPIMISVQKPSSGRKRRIHAESNNLLLHDNLSWQLKTINEKPAEEVLATDKASLARNLKDETTESAVIKVRKLRF